MRHALNIGKEPNFHAIVITSALLHLLLLTFIIIPLKTRENEFKSYFVDLVGPVETFRDAKLPGAAFSKESEKGLSPQNDLKPLPKADMSLESAEKLSKEIERLRAISALSKLKKNKEAEKSNAVEIIRRGILGNASKAQGLPGAQRTNGSDSYYALITRRIWSEWIYPESGIEGLEAIIAIKIDREGKIISQEIEKSSGNSLFDRSAIKAISKSSPLPPPPVEMEIGVRFYL